MLARGNIQLAKRQFVAAEANYRAILKRYPDAYKALDAREGLAAALYHQGRFMEASEIARKAVKTVKGRATCHYLLAVSDIEFAMQYQNTLMHREALREARENLTPLIYAWAEQSTVYYQMGRAHVGLREWKDALRYLRRAKLLAPNSVAIDLELARVLSNLSQRKEAVKLLESSLEKHPDHPEVLNLLGQLLRFINEPGVPQRMVEVFSRVAQIKPDDAEVQQNLGTALLRLQRWDEAKKAFVKAVSLNPHVPYPYQQLAHIYTRLGDEKKANICANNATKMAFNDQQQRDIETWVQQQPQNLKLRLILAERYRDIGQIALARDQYYVVLRLAPKNQRARAGMAQTERLWRSTQKNPASLTPTVS
jgi:tetratricopeptide (TPR) repeat protein